MLYSCKLVNIFFYILLFLFSPISCDCTLNMKQFAVKILVFLFLAVAFEYIFGWRKLLDLCLQFAESNNNPFIFLAIMGIGCALPFSLSICYLFAGAAFPFLQAWIICLAGLFISSSIGYVFGRFIVPPNILESLLIKFKIKPNPYNLANVNFFVRAVPGIPYFVQNLILGGLRSNFATYIVVNLAVQGAIGAVVIYIGSAAASDSLMWRNLWVFALLIGVLTAVQRLIAWHFSKSEPKK